LIVDSTDQVLVDQYSIYNLRGNMQSRRIVAYALWWVKPLCDISIQNLYLKMTLRRC